MSLSKKFENSVSPKDIFFSPQHFDSESLSVTQTSFEFTIFLLWPPECWDYSCMHPYQYNSLKPMKKTEVHSYSLQCW
jgi:hypothetical protein